ncbi:MAG: hypothetical protein AAF533_22555 [Acidobacteriota bacterium]
MTYLLRAVGYGFAFSLGVALFKAAQSTVQEWVAEEPGDDEELTPPPMDDRRHR